MDVSACDWEAHRVLMCRSPENRKECHDWWMRVWNYHWFWSQRFPFWRPRKRARFRLWGLLGVFWDGKRYDERLVCNLEMHSGSLLELSLKSTSSIFRQIHPNTYKKSPWLILGNSSSHCHLHRWRNDRSWSKIDGVAVSMAGDKLSLWFTHPIPKLNNYLQQFRNLEEAEKIHAERRFYSTYIPPGIFREIYWRSWSQSKRSTQIKQINLYADVWPEKIFRPFIMGDEIVGLQWGQGI